MADNMIDTTMSVNEIVARHPGMMPVFKRFGLDTCCGGGAPLAQAAQRDGANLDELVKALVAARSVAGTPR